uniref:Sugar transporter SWEET1 n=1 Tax=Ditylum brightwellii TaxID=49249 RepID=A0A7S4VRF2_9STRA
MVSAGDIILKYVFPTLGAIVATATFSAPVQSLRVALARGSLDGLNTFPWAFMTANTLGWIAYSFVEFNLFVFFANAPGFLISIWLNSGAIKLQYLEQIRPVLVGNVEMTQSNGNNANEVESSGMSNEESPSQNGQNRFGGFGGGNAGQPPPFCAQDKIWLLVVIAWVGLLSFIGLRSTPLDHKTQRDIVGIGANVSLVIFFAAPLSTIATVIKTRDSSTIHIPTMIMNTFNCVFWFSYALAVSDPFIAVPNGLGLLFGAIQIFLYLIFPRRSGLQQIASREPLDELILNEDNISVQ